MYLPKQFEESDTRALHAFIGRRPLATLVSTEGGGLCADHIPMLVARNADGGDVLQGHVARANPLWRNLGAEANVLAIFQDPGGYITPSWYATKAETGKVVPTWNYVAVHAYGLARAVEDAAWLKEFLVRLTQANESGRTAPWQLADAPQDFIAMQLKAIVGIEIRIERLIGKWKASQNRLPKDVDGVVAGLRERGDADALRMANDIEARRRPR